MDNIPVLVHGENFFLTVSYLYYKKNCLAYNNINNIQVIAHRSHPPSKISL